MISDDRKLYWKLKLLKFANQHGKTPCTIHILTRNIDPRNPEAVKRFLKKLIEKNCITPNGSETIRGSDRKTYNLNTKKILVEIEMNAFFQDYILKYIERYYFGGKLLRRLNE